MSLTIEVLPSNKIFSELENNTTSFFHLLSELVDNSIAAMVDGLCSISIEIVADWSSKKKFYETGQIIVHDDAGGISRSEIGQAISPAANACKNPNSLNRHGIGGKITIMSVGTKLDEKSGFLTGVEITTKTKSDDQITKIDQIGFGKIPYSTINDNNIFPKGHGTRITIKNLKPIVYCRKSDYTQIIIPLLGHRYQLYLNGSLNKKVKITLKLLDMDSNPIVNAKGNLQVFEIVPITPVFQGGSPILDTVLHPNKDNKKGWRAHMRFGWSPSKEALAEIGTDKDQCRLFVKKNSPYYIDNRKIDLITNGVVICQVGYDWLSPFKGEETIERDWRGNSPRLIITLENGFQTTITKDAFVDDDNLKTLKKIVLERIKKYANTDKSRIKESEEETKNRVEAMLLETCENVKREPTIGSYGLRADFSLKKKGAPQIWECKIQQASVSDVIQLVGYLKLDGCLNGKLIAPDFSDNARNLVKDCSDIFGVNVELTSYKDLGLQL